MAVCCSRLRLGQLEIHFQITPGLQLIDRTDGQFGGGFGIRFYFP
ncbi:MAG TPA: hypothetical protein PKB07_11820 [Flavilitoribacter sp.]|nr:hypothetical protein [Flavilitoribacter sp.]